MTPRKLSDSDKLDILELYRQPGETTLTLASRYGVSNSTISRILKSSLSDAEYEALVQQKRAARFPGSAPESAAPVVEEPIALSRKALADEVPIPTKRKRQRASGAATSEDPETAVKAEQLELLDVPDSGEYRNAEAMDVSSSAEASALKEMFGADLLDREDFSDLDEEDEDIDELGEEEEEEYSPMPQKRVRSTAIIQVLPLSNAELPKTCYLVVDRAAELIARPLKDFAELGQIPAQEVHQKTLPVFDNHRVARRFSNRTQRVVKVPDGKMLQKTSSHLQAKGITRLLIDGQVYSI